ncbi:MAG: hydroxyethylthiazole kinase [Eubacteriales bacterium]
MKQILDNMKKNSPLVHNITNYVTVNDCANMLLACGAAPIMADDEGEVEEITSISSGLNINIGTLNSRTIPSMFLAGKKANELGHPVILDPVGAGASKLRTETALKLLDEVKFSVIRGNISEIKTLALGSHTTKGVDADVGDKVNGENLLQTMKFAMELSKETGAIIAITGEMDLICEEKNCYIVKNGHPMMSAVSGTGCMLSAVICAFISANPDEIWKATATSVTAMGICGEIAQERLSVQEGNSSYRSNLIDAMYHLDGDTLEKRGKYEIKSL